MSALNSSQSGKGKISPANNQNSLTKAFLDNLYYRQGCTLINASNNDLYMALAYTVRDKMMSSWSDRIQDIIHSKIAGKQKSVAYLSAEFLPGPHLANNLFCLGIFDNVKKELMHLAIDLHEIIEQEEEPGLGNGGLGRLASCYMDSLSNLEIDAIGYGIRYEFGIFRQEFFDGWQIEKTDKWLQKGNPWEMPKPEYAQEVFLGGTTQSYFDGKGCYKVNWKPSRVIKGIPYDTPIIGYQTKRSNTMRLWKAEAVESFDFDDFNRGDYYAAVDEKVASETVSKVLYPNDETDAGKQLRLIQQYFFVSCSLKDMIRSLFFQNEELNSMHKRYAIQLNDTHPSIAIPELMRLLIDEQSFSWEEAWHVTTHVFAYTNHTLLPEALEKWNLRLFQDLLPRHTEIIFEINQRFLDEVARKFPGDLDKISRMSIIDESDNKYVRMANLACVGSHSINGVAKLHSKLLKNVVLKDFFELWPDKFKNVTNGVTPRRWIGVSNNRLSALIKNKIGNNWLHNFQENIRQLERYSDDEIFLEEWQKVKRKNKLELAKWIKDNTGIKVSTQSIFDVQVKRIHEYKRQHLNALHIISLFNYLKDNNIPEISPRVFVFGGKAAPGYYMAKHIIKLIHNIARVINKDKSIQDLIKVVFIPNYNVKTSQLIYPAADVSEQISLAGKEASGTGNMKFSINGALTIGTLDGANVEIREEVEPENFYLFGLNAEEVMQMKSRGYNPYSYYQQNGRLKQCIDQIYSGVFSTGDNQIFKSLADSLVYHDEYLVMADFESYTQCQKKIGEDYKDKFGWARKSVLNVARMGKFSSDRSILDYATTIWQT